MSASAQGMRVSATVWKQLVQNVTYVLDTVEQLIIRVFDQLGGRLFVRPHGGNRLAHHDAEILQCAAGLLPW